MRREELLDAAQQRFLAKGIAGTSIDDIVAAADVAKGTFYLHFASKEAILDALRERFIHDFCARLEEAMERCGPNQWRARLRVWVKTIIEGYLEKVALHDVIFHEVEHYDRQSMSHNPAVDQLTALLKDGAKHGAWKAEQPRSTAIMLFHAFHGGVDAAIAENPKVNRPRLTRMMTTFVERALDVRQDAD